MVNVNIIHIAYVLYVMLLLRDALRQTFMGSSTTTRSGRLRFIVSKFTPLIEESILTDSTTYKGIDGYVCYNVVYRELLQSFTNYPVIPSGGRINNKETLPEMPRAY